ncbi:MAG: MaoC/PaaZ C-terminal domain-containing protein [Acidimicrobiales bacterium]
MGDDGRGERLPDPPLVTDEVVALVGTEVTYRAPEPLGAPSIRHYALAVGADPDRWCHEAFPTLVCDTTQLTGRRRPDASGYLGHTWDLPFPGPTTMVRGGNDYTFHHPIRPDDVIETVWRLDDIVERSDAAGRPMAIVTTTATYTRPDGTVLATDTETLIHRATERPPPSTVGPDPDLPPTVPANGPTTLHATPPSVGDRLPDLVRPLGPVELMAYGAATWDWHRLHHDPDWARAAGFDRPVVDGQLLGALLAHQVTAWAPPGARLTRLRFRNRAPVLSGSTVVCGATVAAVGADGSVTVDQEIRVDDHLVVGPARSVIHLPAADPTSAPATTSSTTSATIG